MFGWPVHVGDNANPRSLRNFPCQANGAEMLRLAACFATEQGIEVCALIHDAVLICAQLDRTRSEDIERMQGAMAKASRIVLDGFELRTDANVIRHPDRYQRPARRRRCGTGCLHMIAQHEANQTGGSMMLMGKSVHVRSREQLRVYSRASNPSRANQRNGADTSCTCPG